MCVYLVPAWRKQGVGPLYCLLKKKFGIVVQEKEEKIKGRSSSQAAFVKDGRFLGFQETQDQENNPKKEEEK
jgi:ABC-type phosphate transport system ATPase subunit